MSGWAGVSPPNFRQYKKGVSEMQSDFSASAHYVYLPQSVQVPGGAENTHGSFLEGVKTAKRTEKWVKWADVETFWRQTLKSHTETTVKSLLFYLRIFLVKILKSTVVSVVFFIVFIIKVMKIDKIIINR